MDGAIRYYREYLKQRPDAVEARSNLGAALSKSGRFDEAIDEYNRALQQDPKNPRVLANLALAYYKTAQFAEAAARFEKVAAMGSNRQVTLLLADCDIRLGKYKQAIDLLAPLEKDSASDDAFNYLYGTALIRNKDSDRGAVIIDRISSQRRLRRSPPAARNHQAFRLRLQRRAARLGEGRRAESESSGSARLPRSGAARDGRSGGRRGAVPQGIGAEPDRFLANLEMGVLTKNDQNFSDSRLYFERALRSRPAIREFDTSSPPSRSQRASWTRLVRRSKAW